MKKSALIFSILVLVSGCNNPFSIRMSADYFPLKVGNKWIYKVEGEIDYKAEMEVLSKDTLYNVTIQGENLFFERKLGEINIVKELKTTYEGEKVIFGKIYEPYLILPLIEGEKWEKKFTLSTVIKGDTIYKNILISIAPAEITSLKVPSGKYDNVYLIKRTRIEDRDTLKVNEWLAPDVGLIKREIPSNSTKWELEAFISNEE
ncbi:MAG: hypothetical protein U9N06_04400 [candidate division WOR-3 bacterium]|nr:hypothetical protein [candidate division WOR-3 bacterium]